MPYTPPVAVVAANQATYDLKRAFELYSATMARLHFEAEILRLKKEPPPLRPRQTSMGSPSGTSQSRQAFLYTAGSLVADSLTPITGQKFEDAATPWEQKWSKLCGAADGFTPVVSRMASTQDLATVSGHTGTVAWNKLIENDAGEVYVHQGRKPAGWRAYSKAVADSFFEVFVAVDGEVLRVLSTYNRENQEGATKPDFDPIDLAADIISGRLLVKLAGNGGSVHLSSAFTRKNSGRTALLGPVEKPVAAMVIAAVRAAGDDAIQFGTYSRAMGIPKKHFDAMVAAAKETDSIAVFRANKEVAIDLIEKGAVGKEKALSMQGFKTDPKTGVLTAETIEQMNLVTRNPDYYIVNADLEVARTVTHDGKLVRETINVHPAYWNLKPGQVIHKSGHPVVGDYDLMGVLPRKSPGSAAVGVPADGLKGDWLGPHVGTYMNKLNPKLDKPRVLHGAQDQFHGPGGGFDDGVAYAVFPDGKVVIMNGRAEQEAFYKAMKRKTPDGSYNPDLPKDTVVKDELAERRAKKKK